MTIFFIPIVLIGGFVFGTWVLKFPTQYVAAVPWIMWSVLSLIGAGCLAVLAAFAIHFIGKPTHQMLLETVHSLVEARVKWNQRHILDSGPAHVAYLQDGRVLVTPIIQERHHYQHKPELGQGQEPLQLEPSIPDFVRYDEIKPHIPAGRALVGVSVHGVETKDGSVRAFIWIVGASGAGKTNSIMLRVDNDYEQGHWFLAADPHWFKDESLTNALRGTIYETRLVSPLATRPQEILDVLTGFITEFEQRKGGKAWQQKITLLVDEVGSLNAVEEDDKLGKKILVCLKKIARICGQESRNFGMAAIFISQEASGLAWLRKYALMVIAHQVLMWNERLLVCNNNTEHARSIDSWPKGRTLVYGIAFTAGPRIVQQPLFTVSRNPMPRLVSAAPPDIEPLFPQPVSEMEPKETPVSPNETALEASSEAVFPFQEAPALHAQKYAEGNRNGNAQRDYTKKIVKRMLKQGKLSQRDMAFFVGMSGEKYKDFQTLLAEIEQEQKETDGSRESGTRA